MTELINAAESAAFLAQQRAWVAQQAERFHAFVVIVGGGALMVLAVIFFHSPLWKKIQEEIVFPLLMAGTVASCVCVMAVIARFHWQSRQCNGSP